MLLNSWKVSDLHGKGAVAETLAARCEALSQWAPLHEIQSAGYPQIRLGGVFHLYAK